MATLPKASTPVLQSNGLMAPEWYRLFSVLVGDANALTGATGSAGTMPGNPTGAAAADTRMNAAAVKAFLAIAAGEVSGLSPVATYGSYSSLTGSWSFVDNFAGVIQAPKNGSILVWPNVSFPFTVNSFTTYCATGTCYVEAQKQSVTIGGLGNSTSGSFVTSNATSGNVFSGGEYFNLNISSVSSATFLAFNLKFTRTLP